jgi:DNA-binding LacI/PurR family transcriptional regulator
MTTRRRLTSLDVARACGLSRATVSYVLNNDTKRNIPPETRERVLQAARRLGYHPFAPARILRAGQSRLILGVVQFERVDPVMAGVMHYLQRKLIARNFTLVWHVDAKMALEPAHPSNNVTPAAVLAIVNEKAATVPTFLRQFGVPIVSVMNLTVGQDVGRMQVRRLISQGIRAIAFAAPERTDLQSLSAARLEGVRLECAKLGLKRPIVQVVPSSRIGAQEAVAKIFSRGVRRVGICCYNDEVALALLAALSDAGIVVPEEVAVIGCDNTSLGELTTPPLTTISFNPQEYLDLLIDNIVAVCNGARPVRNTVIPLSLVIRGSG